MQVSNNSSSSPYNKQQIDEDQTLFDFVNKNSRDPQFDDQFNDQYSSFTLSSFQNSEKLDQFSGFPGHPQKVMNISSISSIKGGCIEEKGQVNLDKNQTINENRCQPKQSHNSQNSYASQQNPNMKKNNYCQPPHNSQNDHDKYDSKETQRNSKTKKCSKYVPNYAPKYLPKFKKKYSYEEKKVIAREAESQTEQRLTPTYEIMNIKPYGRKSWPSISIYIKKKKIVLAHRELLEQIADIMIIPYKQLKLDIYPGNFVNVLKYDYRKKMRQLEQKGMLKDCFIQQCIGLRNFYGICFMKLKNTESSLSSSLNETFKAISTIKKPVKSVLLPYSTELGSPKEVIELIIKEGESDNTKGLEEIYITMYSLGNFVDGMVGFCEIIKELHKKNEIYTMQF